MEIYKVSNVLSGAKLPYNAILHLYLVINHKINDYFPIFLHIFRQSTKTKILEVSKSLEKVSETKLRFYLTSTILQNFIS